MPPGQHFGATKPQISHRHEVLVFPLRNNSLEAGTKELLLEAIDTVSQFFRVSAKYFKVLENIGYNQK